MDNVLLLDREVAGRKRMTFSVRWQDLKATSFEDCVAKYKKVAQNIDKVVQYVDYATGETLKGPAYDSTELEVFGVKIEDSLKPGVKQQQPIEPSQAEPRDRFQENSNMNELTKFKNLVKECLAEVKQESNPRHQLKESLRNVVKEVLSEISSGVKPEPTKEEKEKVSKGYAKDGNERLDKENTKLVKELETLVHGINSEWNVYIDDNKELNVDAKNLLRVRITPKFENNFDIDAMVKLCDRIRVIAVTWEQVKAFIKANFSDLKDETSADVAKQKSTDNREDKDKDSKDAGPRHDITKVKKVADTKKDNKDYNEKEVKKDEDQPDQPMADASKSKALNKNIEKTPHVKPPKIKSEEGSDKLKTDLPATKKFRVKKS